MNDVVEVDVEVFAGKPEVVRVDPPSARTAKITLLDKAPSLIEQLIEKEPVINIVISDGTVMVNPSGAVKVTVYDYDILDLQCDDTALRIRRGGDRPERCLVTIAEGQLCFM